MLNAAKRTTLFGGLYAVTLSILLIKGVHLDQALLWGAVASSAKFAIVSIHSWAWAWLTAQSTVVECVTPNPSDAVGSLAADERRWMRHVDDLRHGQSPSPISVFEEQPFA